MTREKNCNLNIGHEYRLLDRISGTIEWYDRRTDDLLLESPMAISLGFPGYYDNVGSISNSGFDITLGADIISTQDMRWNVTLIGSTLRNRVLKLTDDGKDIVNGVYIIREGERITEIGILLKGHLFIQSIDYWGNRSIISEIKENDIFAEAYAVSSFLSLNDVIASEESIIIRLNVKKILISPDIPRQTLMQNLLGILAEKNRILVRKNGPLAKRTTREKLLSYLSEEEKKRNSPSFSIPFNRQELADFLSVDRSAMSSAVTVSVVPFFGASLSVI